MNIPFFLLSNDMQEFILRQKKRDIQRRLKQTVAWDLKMRWDPELNLKAKTYKTMSLFKVKPLPSNRVSDAKNGQLVLSPKGNWCYCEKVLPGGGMLETALGSRRGTVVFDGKVIIPAIHRRIVHSDDGDSHWDGNPWMSLTPMEFFSLRPGTRRAKGHVIVAGLGMGHQLIEVSKRKAVKRLVVVEKDQELVDWLMPVIEPHLGRPIDELVVGDAYEEMPKMEADVALVDIFKSYGSNTWDRDKLTRSCRNISFIWAWGSSHLS